MSGVGFAVRANKGPIGLVFASVATGCFFGGFRLASELFGLVSAFLLGAGLVKDDRTERNEQAQYVTVPRSWK